MRLRCVTAVLIAVAAAGCWPQGEGLGVMQVPSAYTQAEEAYLSGDYYRSKLLFLRFADTQASSPFVGWAHYWIGKCNLQTANTRAAKADFQRALESQVGPDLEALATVGMGDAYYNEKDYRQAYGYYRRVAGSRMAGKVRREEIEFKLGMCQRELGSTPSADRHFDRAQELDPKGMYGALSGAMRSSGAAPAARGAGGGHEASGWYVQAGAFSREENARDLQRSLRARGFRADIVAEQKAGSAIYSVRAGVFSTEAEARARARDLQAAGFQCIVKR